jgi:hypothetical protein
VIAGATGYQHFRGRERPYYPDDVAQEVSLGPSPEPHLKAIHEYIEAGFDHLILTQIGPEQDPFFEFFERQLRPTLSAGSPKASTRPN